jgi:hypothetical protein
MKQLLTTDSFIHVLELIHGEYIFVYLSCDYMADFGLHISQNWRCSSSRLIYVIFRNSNGV